MSGFENIQDKQNNSYDQGTSRRPLCRFLDTVGDGSGIKNAIGNHAVTPQDYFIMPNVGVVSQGVLPESALDVKAIRINRLIIDIHCSLDLQTSKYGSSGDLVEGIRIGVQDVDGTDILFFDDNVPILTNGDWGRYCYDESISEEKLGKRTGKIRWSFNKGMYPIRLTKGQKFFVRLNDDFSSINLTEHYFCVQGFYEGILI